MQNFTRLLDMPLFLLLIEKYHWVHKLIMPLVTTWV